MKTGSEALEAPKKGESKGKTEKKGEKKPAKKGGLRLAEVRVRPLADGTHHIVHHYEDAKHLPHHHTPEYSAASVQDVQDHMAEHLPGGAGDAGDAQGGADPAAAGAGADPGAGAGAELPGE